MIKAIFCDFYGTVVYKNGPFALRAAEQICRSAGTDQPDEVLTYWRQRFKNRMRRSNFDDFRKQRDLLPECFEKTLEHFGADLPIAPLCDLMEQNFTSPRVFEDAEPVLTRQSLPVYLIADSDEEYIRAALQQCAFSPTGVLTSEEARCYKADRTIFSLALKKWGLSGDEVLHIGDSLPGDVACAGAAGIRAVWLNRSGNPVPEGVASIGSFDELERCIADDR